MHLSRLVHNRDRMRAGVREVEKNLNDISSAWFCKSNFVSSSKKKKNTVLRTCALSISVFPAVTFNNRISAELSSKKEKKTGAGEGRIKSGWDHCYH